jgi:acyl carrier protein
MISDKLKELICTELDLEITETEIDELTTANQLPGWDSLRNVSIIVRIEYVYGVKLKMIEILRCKNLGDLQKLVDSKTGAA